MLIVVSGFIGSRVCQTLVESGAKVLSVSRKGGPPSWAASSDQKWVDRVVWLSADIMTECGDNDTIEDSKIFQALGRIDGAVSCVGAIQPQQEFGGFFGVSFDDDTLRDEISTVNRKIINLSRWVNKLILCLMSCTSENLPRVD